MRASEAIFDWSLEGAEFDKSIAGGLISPGVSLAPHAPSKSPINVIVYLSICAHLFVLDSLRTA